MKTLEEIRSDLADGRIELTIHSLRRIIERNISKQEIAEAGNDGEEIEDYPDDKYFPSCLLLGFTSAGRPLHLQVSRIPSENARLITIYEPNSEEWVDSFRKRRK
jgi:hypothetical protein